MSLYPKHQDFEKEQDEGAPWGNQDDVVDYYQRIHSPYGPRENKVGATIGNFHGARNVSLRGNVVNANRDYINITHNNNPDDMNILMKLADAACLEAGHEIVKDVDRPKCHEDTRKAVITDIMSWINSNDPEEKLMWLKGPAGAGKSSIAQSICIQCREEGKLISSFFFSRAVGGRRADGTKLIATIAYQLTQALPESKKYLVEELASNPAMLAYTAHATDLQFEKLVLQPLTSAVAGIQDMKPRPSIPHVIVVDGLDECHNIQLQSKIITLFASALAPPHLNVKCLIASRPELEIRNTFSQETVSQITTEIILDDDYNPDADIQTYLLSEFSAIKRSHVLSSYIRQIGSWPDEDDLNELVKRASGQFIYAATVIKYVKDQRHNPIDRLKEIICIRPGQESQYKELDALYAHILNSAVQNADGYENILRVFQIMLQNSILSTIYNMASFLNVPEHNILLSVVDLHSLMFVPNAHEDMMKFFHASFIDYLKDEHRSRSFFVEEKTAHKVLAHYCLVNAIENESQYLRTDHSSPVNYSRDHYLHHLAMSNFDHELLEELENKGNLQSIINQFIMQFCLDTDRFDRFDTVNSFFTWDLFNEYLAMPKNERIKSVCECLSNAMDDFVITQLCSESNEFLHFSYLNHLKDHGPPQYFFDRWTKGTLLSPFTAKLFYLGDKRCQHIWRRLWKVLRSSESDAILNDCMELIDLPLIFQYLLERIEPSFEFKSFLGDFLVSFETWFITETDPESSDVPDTWTLLKCSISTYIKNCDDLFLFNYAGPTNNIYYPYSGDEMEDVPLNYGVIPPWIITNDGSDEFTSITYSDFSGNGALSDDYAERSLTIDHQSQGTTQHPNPMAHSSYIGSANYQTWNDSTMSPLQNQYDTQIFSNQQDFIHQSNNDWDMGNVMTTEFPTDFDYDFFMAMTNHVAENIQYHS